MGVEEIGLLYRNYMYGGLNENEYKAELRVLQKQLTREERRSILYSGDLFVGDPIYVCHGTPQVARKFGPPHPHPRHLYVTSRKGRYCLFCEKYIL